MTQDYQPSKPFDDFRNIEVGLARVIYEGDSWYGLTGWKLPGLRTTVDRDEAHACAIAMNAAMGGAQVMREPCQGANCGATDGKSHSQECFAQTAQDQGWVL